MCARPAARASGLDVSLLGVIVAGVGASLDYVADAAGTTPHLVRFFDEPSGGGSPPGVPQDAALLLLADPSTTGSGTLSGGTPVLSLGTLPALLTFVGAVLVVAGPLWALAHR